MRHIRIIFIILSIMGSLALPGLALANCTQITWVGPDGTWHAGMQCCTGGMCTFTQTY